MFNKSSSQKSAPSVADNAKKTTATRQTPTRAKVPTILSSDLVVTGDVVTDGDVQIEGRLEGNIKANTITVGEKGAINGSIQAQSILVRGKVTGKINAETVELAETSNVLADITQDHLKIENGAFFDGNCTRRSNPSAKTAKASTATS